jgi:hypothetical protein
MINTRANGEKTDTVPDCMEVLSMETPEINWSISEYIVINCYQFMRKGKDTVKDYNREV